MKNSDFVNRHLEQIPIKKEKALKLFEATKGNFYCDKCKGTTQGSKLCENVSCPNMPCCDKPREKCDCVWGEKISTEKLK